MQGSICRERRFVLSVLRKLMKNDECDIYAKCLSIQDKCKGDGCGLVSGTLIDMVFTQLLSKQNRLQVRQHHIGEADLLFSQILKTQKNLIPLSFKKINGKGNIALHWSKNVESEVGRSSHSHIRSKPTNHILILNLRDMHWWKQGPKQIQKGIPKTLDFTTPVRAGLYFIDKDLCSKYVTLSSNNKTSALITDQNVFYLLQLAIKQKSMIFLPPPKAIPRMMICFDYRNK